MANGTISEFAEWPTGTLWAGATMGVSWVDLNTLPDRANWKRKTDADFGVVLPKVNKLTPTNDALYFRFYPTRNKGVVGYDGKTWHRITRQNGLAHAGVGDILNTDNGTLIVGLGLILISLTTLQTTRVIRRDRRLREANTALSDANKELFHANLEIKQQSERKSTFLASMSHEIRTPITSIKGYIDNMLDRDWWGTQ